MNTDFTVIAEALRVTKRAIELRANREAWPFEEEAVRGGRRKVFVLDSLPAEIVRAVRRHLDISSKGKIASQVIRQLAGLRAADAERSAKKQARGKKTSSDSAPSPPHRCKRVSTPGWKS